MPKTGALPSQKDLVKAVPARPPEISVQSGKACKQCGVLMVRRMQFETKMKRYVVWYECQKCGFRGTA